MQRRIWNERGGQLPFAHGYNIKAQHLKTEGEGEREMQYCADTGDVGDRSKVECRNYRSEVSRALKGIVQSCSHWLMSHSPVKQSM